MLISWRYKFIFIHVPKTAGMSVEAALRPVCGRPAESRVTAALQRFGRRPSCRDFHRHAPYWQVASVLPPDVLRSFFKFAFVRNPWDRMVSLYSYILDSPGHHLHDHVRSLGSFDSFVRWRTSEHPEDQVGFVDDTRGNVAVDFVGRFENLNDDFDEAMRRLGLTGRIPHLNPSPRTGDWRSHYTRASFDRVAEYSRRDLHAFGYDARRPGPE